jgi:hypothetical protein
MWSSDLIQSEPCFRVSNMPSCARKVLFLALVWVLTLSAEDLAGTRAKPLTPPELAAAPQTSPKRPGRLRRLGSLETEIGVRVSSIGIPDVPRGGPATRLREGGRNGASLRKHATGIRHQSGQTGAPGLLATPGRLRIE